MRGVSHLSKRFVKKLLVFCIVAIVIALLFFWILPVSLPILFALVTALFLEPAVKILSHRFKLKRYFSVLIVFSLFMLLMGISGYFLVTKVVTEVISFVENSPSYITEVKSVWDDIEHNIEIAAKDLPEEVVIEINHQVDSFLDSTREKLLEPNYIAYLTSLVSLIPNYLVSILVYLITLFLLLLDLPRLKRRTYAHLSEKTAEKVHFMTSRLSFVVFGFLKAQFLVSIVIFIAALIGLYIIAPDVALLMSLIIWIIDFIPIIGSIVILGPWAIYHLLVGNVALGVKLSILAIVLLILRRTVEPKVMGQHIGLSPLSTLVSMYLGLKLLGAIGFIIGPLTLILFNSAREAGLIKMNFKL
jgi:sporulation integral membrane protein YtvI